jgi:Ca2+/Na+ antiporter
MQTGLIIAAVFTLLLSIGAFVIAYLQAKEKGPVFNNAYIYASKKERATMDRKPHYRLSRDVFFLLGLVFILLTLQIILAVNWLSLVNLALILLTIVYAIAKSYQQSKKK